MNTICTGLLLTGTTVLSASKQTTRGEVQSELRKGLKHIPETHEIWICAFRVSIMHEKQCVILTKENGNNSSIITSLILDLGQTSWVICQCSHLLLLTHLLTRAAAVGGVHRSAVFIRAGYCSKARALSTLFALSLRLHSSQRFPSAFRKNAI